MSSSDPFGRSSFWAGKTQSHSRSPVTQGKGVPSGGGAGTHGTENVSGESSPNYESRASLRVDANTKEPLHACVRHAVENYFAQLHGHSMSGLYQMVMQEVEGPLLEAVMRHTRGNQSKAAVVLGLNRGTLRKKLKRYNLM